MGKFPDFENMGFEECMDLLIWLNGCYLALNHEEGDTDKFVDYLADFEIALIDHMAVSFDQDRGELVDHAFTTARMHLKHGRGW